MFVPSGWSWYFPCYDWFWFAFGFRHIIGKLFIITITNSFHSNISGYILHTALFTFPMVMSGRIFLTIRSVLNKGSSSCVSSYSCSEIGSILAPIFKNTDERHAWKFEISIWNLFIVLEMWWNSVSCFDTHNDNMSLLAHEVVDEYLDKFNEYLANWWSSLRCECMDAFIKNNSYTSRYNKDNDRSVSNFPHQVSMHNNKKKSPKETHTEKDFMYSTLLWLVSKPNECGPSYELVTRYFCKLLNKSVNWVCSCFLITITKRTKFKKFRR